MRIRITARGVYGAQGEIPVGTEFDVVKTPVGLAGKYEIVSAGQGGEKVTITNPAEGGLKAVHYGGGKFRVLDGDTVLLTGLSKAEADEFNALDAEGKAARVSAGQGGE